MGERSLQVPTSLETPRQGGFSIKTINDWMKNRYVGAMLILTTSLAATACIEGDNNDGFTNSFGNSDAADLDILQQPFTLEAYHFNKEMRSLTATLNGVNEPLDLELSFYDESGGIIVTIDQETAKPSTTAYTLVIPNEEGKALLRLDQSTIPPNTATIKLDQGGSPIVID